jgi:cyclophilin family peptidyl-prolyl cis-trans isomerase
MRRARPKRRDTICEASGVRAVEIERVIAQKCKQTGDVTGGKGAGGGTAGVVVSVKGGGEQDGMERGPAWECGSRLAARRCHGR